MPNSRWISAVLPTGSRTWSGVNVYGKCSESIRDTLLVVRAANLLATCIEMGQVSERLTLRVTDVVKVFRNIDDPWLGCLRSLSHVECFNFGIIYRHSPMISTPLIDLTVDYPFGYPQPNCDHFYPSGLEFIMGPTEPNPSSTTSIDRDDIFLPRRSQMEQHRSERESVATAPPPKRLARRDLQLRNQ
ncbi:uncharacterized protein CC84DRAFT_1181940 [Paraphaeosphaeria sporulosa]|uniref:Uncharacterized protein n=1 Tax=Paraphaeosphaeria sporulosa TaxID=1460663 RepID=A0A177BUG8_9PLEO|nr:uncharacterized protein CC84DRAFT_1181940 [Paraphaeosphaeria sporulosa]OAF98785.1 hypothetical protein CC84DRAFT_1181940 [Paraphaeosphaeria sporulosa]